MKKRFGVPRWLAPVEGHWLPPLSSGAEVQIRLFTDPVHRAATALLLASHDPENPARWDPRVVLWYLYKTLIEWRNVWQPNGRPQPCNRRTIRALCVAHPDVVNEILTAIGTAGRETFGAAVAVLEWQRNG